MELTGYITKILKATTNIDAGRKGFATRGKEQEGRISYEKGIAEALTSFQQAQTAADPQALILAEYTFLTQELELCPKSDKHTLNSLTQAVQSFDDAFLAIQVVENITSYKDVDKAFPHHKKYRYKGYPKDAYHIACSSHQTRIKNILRSPGIDPIEKALLKQRYANLTTAQSGYLQKQKKAIISKK